MGVGGTRSRGSSQSSSQFTPEQRNFQRQAFNAAGRQLDAGEFDFGRAMYGGPLTVAPSEAQVRGLGSVTNGITDSVDYSQLRSAGNANFSSLVQNVLGPQLRERASIAAGYGGDYGRQVADPIAEQALALEQFYSGLEANSAEQAKQRQLGILSNLDAYQRALDPNQASAQDDVTRRYEEFLRSVDPSFLQTLLSIIPGGLESQSSSRNSSDSARVNFKPPIPQGGTKPTG